MKKSILAVLVLLVIIGFLPTIGNSFIKKTIDERILELKSYGLETSKDEILSSYLNTSRHFEFILKDSQKFIDYLQQYSDKQIPPYINALFEGVRIGADIQYSNLPFAKAFEIEIYPMTLSQKMSENLQKKNLDVYKKLKNFLALKGLLYHIEYNLLNEDFKGYLKDINETFVLEDGTELILTLDDAKFKGNGTLLAPNELSSKIDTVDFSIQQNNQNLKVVFKKLKSSTNFESANTYLTNLDVKNMLVRLEGNGNDINITLDKLKINASSNDQGDTTQLNSKTSVKSLLFRSNRSNFTMKKFNFDVALSALDKQEYLHLTQLLSQKNLTMTPQSTQKMQSSIVKLLSKGLVLEIADFSVSEFARETPKMIKGFSLQSTLTIKEDKDLQSKMSISPLMAIQNINLESKIKISKEMYTQLQKNNGLLTRLGEYEKKDGDDYIFILKFVDGKSSINGKSLQ